jgi:hypothetical protein
MKQFEIIKSRIQIKSVTDKKAVKKFYSEGRGRRYNFKSK